MKAAEIMPLPKADTSMAGRSANRDGERPADAVSEDGRIVREVLAGRSERFESLVHRYEAAIYCHAWRIMRNREDAEDVTQETFARAFTRLGAFDPSRPLRPWLYRIATNLALSALRRRRPVASLDDASVRAGGVLKDHRPGPDERTERILQCERIDEAMSRLPESTRALLSLRYHEDLPIKDISRILEQRPETVKVALHRARLRLRELVFGRSEPTRKRTSS